MRGLTVNDRLFETSDQTDGPSGTDIAIVGMAGRFPGAADVGALWSGIRAGASGLTRFSDAELRAAGVAEDLLADPAYVKAAPVVDGVEQFDAGFFGVNPKEAQILDPQHRLFLEHCWEALEDAACDPARFEGLIGVIAGCAWSSYLTNNLEPAGVGQSLGEMAVGLANDRDSLTTRVAHALGLTGPSYTVQSYCSTSLVAVCAAATALANFEADMVLAGGVALSVPHRVGYLYQPGGITPPDGECRAFDAAGLGSPIGNGVGVVALRRLEDALADGDRVYAVIRGWAVNNDGGRKVGFTAPGVQGQAAVIAEALAAAGLEPSDVGYVEAHGTGTALGDAAELAALQQVFDGASVRVGSVKSNLGHLDRAAGVTNLIKAALVLHRGEIPPTRNFTDPNPQLGAGGAELEVVTELTPWPRTPETVRRVGVSAFGIGGTNAHVVLQEAPLPTPADPDADADDQRPEVLMWSARSAEAADAMTEKLSEHLQDTDDELTDIANTLQTGRKVFEHRRIAVGSTAAELASALRDNSILTRTDGRSDREVAFLIAGTGEQYPGLAEDLYRTEPVFREVLDECRAVLQDKLGRDVLTDMLRPRDTAGAGDLARLLGRGTEEESAEGQATAVLQPALFAVEYALAKLLESWGIRPGVIVGYSLGEYVAAALSGVLSLPDALALVAHRAQLIDAQPHGAMAAVPIAAADVAARIERAGIAELDVAAVNGPELTVVSGTAEAVAALTALLEPDAIPVRVLTTTHAFHSSMLAGIKAELTAWVAANITTGAPQTPYLSNVTGTAVTAEQVADPGYWAEHMCAPVQFDAMLAELLAAGDPVLLELGPGPSLGTMARAHRACSPERWPLIVPTLPGGADPRSGATVLAEALGRLWLTGVPVDWSGYREGHPAARRVSLPTYRFQRQRYWIDAPAGGRAAAKVKPAAQLTGPVADAEHVQLLSPRWTTAELSGTAATPDRFVVLGESELADAIAATLRADGADVAVVGDGFGTDHASATTTVIDLRALASDAGEPGALVPGVAAALDAWGSTNGTTRYLIATAGGQAVADGEIPNIAQAALAALPAVANQEYLNLDCRAVDFASNTDLDGHEESARVLATEASGDGEEVLVAYRDGRRHIREHVSGLPGGEPVPVRSGGTYLITGGLGDVGLLVAGHLAASGASRLVLASRSGIPAGAGDRRSDGVRRLTDRGVEVLTPQLDITDADAVRALFAELGRIDGVIHAAATTSPDTFRALRDLDADTVATHFGAKVDGALVLREVLGGLPEDQTPDFCLLFSSTSSLLGGITFGSYAAANAALTAVAELGDTSTTRWLAAAWDTWSITLERLQSGFGAGMAAHSMSTEQAFTALDALLAKPRAATAVVAGGLGDRLPRAAALLDAAIGTGERFPRPELAQPYTAPLTATERALTELWSDVLGIEPVGTRDAFFDLGGNSLLALQMLALVKKRFGVSVPAVQLFEAPTVQTLAAILDGESGQSAQSTAAAVVTQRPIVRAGTEEDRLIAVVGMAGRFPGAPNVEAFWHNIREGVESISFFSDEELLASGVTPEELADPSYVRARPVLDDVSGFDAAFFGMNPRMATLTDPQQRLFLEVCWEALEQSGYVVPELRGRVGVYGGANISSYLMRMPEQMTSGDFSVYEVIMGNDKDALTTTVSYLLDLYGPSVAVQTFCSTSLVATHLAIQSLRSGESDMAIAGGVSVRVPDKIGHEFMPGGMESPDGHVRTFDAEARGSMFGDGAAAVVLKRLSDALRDGDHIWSVIRGSAMNNDGALKVGFTAPSVIGQSRVIVDAMADAGVTGDDISYIEAHGTATELGDPIEVTALTRAFGETDAKQYCPIGSVKTNVGHLDRAAGVTGLIKTSLALTDQVIPPSLHYTAPNPRIDFANSPFYVNTELTPWRTREGRPALAGLNSLGMGGTNVHLVVQQAPVRAVADPADTSTMRRYQVLPLSARTPAAVEATASRLADFLADAPRTRLVDVAYTMQVGRKRFDHRRALVADGLAAVQDKLREGDLLGRVDAVTGRPVAFLFSGVGEQYPGLVRELYQREPVFRALLDECLGHLRTLIPDADLKDLLTGERGGGGASDLAAMLGRSNGSDDERAALLERTEIVQPAMFAVEYALAMTLMTWGVQPKLMLGYSLGEYVAACLAGVLSLPDALKLVAHRAELISAIGAGAMTAVSATPADLAAYKLADRGLDIAAVNGPQVTVVAGPVEAMAAFVAELRDAEVPHRALSTTHAFHSRMLEPLQDRLTEWVAANVTLNAPQIPYLSNVTGTRVGAEDATDPAYWSRHMCRTVRFGDAIAALLADPEIAILEIGPGQSLGTMIRGAKCPPDRWPLILATLPAADDKRPDDLAFTEALARLWVVGADPDFVAYQGRNTVGEGDDPLLPGRIPLPTYPFQRQRYWTEIPTGATTVAAPRRAALPTPAQAAKPRAKPEPEEVLVEVLRPRWSAAPIAAGAGALGKVVLVADEGGVAEALSEVLAASGAEVVCVPGGPALTREEHAAIVAREAAEDRTTVVDLRLLDRPAGDAADLDGRDVIQPLARLLDAWGSDGTGSARMLIATRGGQPVGGDVPRPAQHAAAVLQVVANLEYLNLECGTVDVGADADAPTVAAALAAEIGRPSDVDDVLVGYRDGERHVRDYVPADAPPAEPVHQIRTGGSYLITGGLGDLGLILAEHFAASGAGRLILTSRTGAPEGGKRLDRLEALRAAGVEVLTPAVDVTDADAMRAVLADALADGGRIDGIVHAAAVTHPDTFRALRAVDDEAVGLHFGAKVGGALVLDGLLAELAADPEFNADQAPEFCLLFSSTSSVLGGIAFACYAGGNAALAAIGQRNHARFLAGDSPTRWISTSWDTWSVTIDSHHVGAVMIKHSMTREQALAAFDATLAGPGPSLVVAAGGLTDRLPRAMALTDVVGGGEKFPRPDLPQPYSAPSTDAERSLAELWSHLLGVEPVGVKDAFFDLGGNSLLALQMLALVKKRFGVAIPAVTLFEAPTVQGLAAILDNEGATDKEAASVAARRAERPAAVGGNRSAGLAASDDDRRIAVIGMAGRFPGASDVEQFWTNVRGGVETISFFTDEELLASGVTPEELADPAYVRARPVLPDVRGFDASFFGMSPRMAALTDPQQRLFLEVCWEALEQAGYAAPEGRSRVGVYGGSNISTYLMRHPEILADPEFSVYEVLMGNDKDALTTTVSYLLDLYGPSIAVQTFCSTSLVATHMAVQALRNGECEIALAGGSSVHVPEKVGHRFEAGGMASPDGHVRTFDAGARGSMFGDGAAVVALKRLSDALRDGDHIWSVIRGSAVNNDGALKVGFTAPSVVGQSSVVIEAMADAGVTGDDISYIEAHGTATELGDPIEVAALTRAFGDTDGKQYCPIGSVKTNVGHLDRAAGVTGLIKTSLALKDQMIPASLHYETPNPNIDFEDSPFYVNTELSPWQTRDGRPPIAGINSLGMGGTNVHVVVEQAPERVPAEPADPNAVRRYHVVPMSARNSGAVEAAAERLGAYLLDAAADAPDLRLRDVAYTMQAGRKLFEHRRAVVADGVEQLAAALTGPDKAAVLGRLDTTTSRPVAFLFSGVGEQYPGMVRELYRREPVFRTLLDECLEHLRVLIPDADLKDLLTGTRGGGADLAALLGRGGGSSSDERASALERTEVVQPAMFAVEYALAKTLMTWGVQPKLMLGYSLGEYVAACLAGVLSLSDALALVAQRAKLIGAQPAGGMAAVSLSPKGLEKYGLAARGLDIAAVNGPEVTVVAGPDDALAALGAELLDAEIPFRPLQTTHAFHSRMLEPVREALTEWVKTNVTLNAPRVPYISNTTGTRVGADQVTDPGYWARHMCQPVQFATAISTLLADPDLAVVEIGPGQSLGALVRAAGCPPERWSTIVSTLPAAGDGRADDAVLTDCLARLWLVGADLDWATMNDRQPGARPEDPATVPNRVPLPTYAFQRQVHWIDAPMRPAVYMGGVTGGAAGGGVGGVGGETTLETVADLPKLPEEQWLHLPVWRQTAAPAAVELPESWLVFSRDGVAERVVERLRGSGAAVTVVRPGEAYADGDYAIRPGNLDDTLRLLRDLRANGGVPSRVVHLWALGSSDPVVDGLHTLVTLARAAGEVGIDDWSLDVVTAGAQQVLPGDATDPLAATLTGPALVIPVEYPSVTARLIDLDARPTAKTVAALTAELARPAADRIVALRHGRRWICGFESMPAEPQSQDAVTLRESGVYLITGGLGGIALAMAERLAAECRAKLVLFGRTGLPPREQWSDVADEPTRERVRKVQALLDLGAEVEIVVGDLGRPEDVRRAVDTAVDRFGALHGVLHAAGLPGMGLMQFKEPEQLDTVLAPKVAGTLALAEALRFGEADEIELDFLVLFSSITSATGGGPGQVDYCSANAFLDAFAAQQSAAGRPVVAVDWGEWLWNAWSAGLDGYAEALRSFLEENRTRIGIGFDEGWRCLRRALAAGEPRVVVSTQDFGSLVRLSSQFTLDAVAATAALDGGTPHPRPELMTPFQEPDGATEETIARMWRESLRLDQVGVLDNFFELGGNSLLGVTIVTALRKEFGLDDLPPHTLYEAPTVAALAEVVDKARSGAPVPMPDADAGVRAQLRRSGVRTAAARRRSGS
ncbi:acyl transferase domain-containing protein/acyl carrier protein [Catenulispora sp. MAP5-51]